MKMASRVVKILKKQIPTLLIAMKSSGRGDKTGSLVNKLEHISNKVIENCSIGMEDTDEIHEVEINDEEFEELEWALIQTHLYEMGLWTLIKRISIFLFFT